MYLSKVVISMLDVLYQLVAGVGVSEEYKRSLWLLVPKSKNKRNLFIHLGQIPQLWRKYEQRWCLLEPVNVLAIGKRAKIEIEPCLVREFEYKWPMLAESANWHNESDNCSTIVSLLTHLSIFFKRRSEEKGREWSSCASSSVCICVMATCCSFCKLAYYNWLSRKSNCICNNQEHCSTNLFLFFLLI